MTQQSVLSEDQNAYFDYEYVGDEYFKRLNSILLKTFDHNSPLLIADLGSGTGRFLDRILSAFPRARGFGIDFSAELLSRNQPHARKTLINASFLEYRPGTQFDIVSLNWVLHHMVYGSPRETRQLIRKTICHSARLLKPGGRFVVFENIVDGIVNDNLSSNLLYRGTSSRRLARLTRRLGANTAGVGIHYLGQNELLNLMDDQGFELDESFAGSFQPYGRKNLLILARSVREYGFVFGRRAN